MIKKVEACVWAFDAEWVPDPVAGRAVYDLDESMSDADVIDCMWREGGAADADPRPYLKTVVCRVVSLAVVMRKKKGRDVIIELATVPDDAQPVEEAKLLEWFFSRVACHEPQLVGFNSYDADLPILVQRAVAKGIAAPHFNKRPNKPSQGRDYFAKFNEWHVDLKSILAGFGRQASLRLHDIAAVSGIPGKIGTDGKSVVDLWQAGKMQQIVEYNLCDALTTYLVWLRVTHFAGLFSNSEYAAEVDRLDDALQRRIADRGEELLRRYLTKWYAMRK